MSLPKSILVGLLAAHVANAAPQIGLPAPVLTSVAPVVKTIFKTLPTSLPADVKTTSAIVDGATRAIIIPATLPTTAPQVVQGATKTAADIVQTVTAFLADPVPSGTLSIGKPVSLAPQVTIQPSVGNNASVPILSGTHTIGVTSIGDQATNLIQSAIATASAPGPNAIITGPNTSTCGALGQEYNDGDMITSGDSTYTIHCSSDNDQGSFAFQFVAFGGFNACPSACDATPGCVGFTFVGDESGICYLKSAEGSYHPALRFITSAFKKTASPGGGSSSSSSSAPSSSSSSAPSSTPTASPGKSCSQVGKTYVDGKNQTYTVACNTDLPGNDIGAVQASSFSDCFDQCGKKDGCVAFSFVGGSGSGPCYLKNSAAASASNSNNVDSAYLPSARPSASSTSQGASGSASAAPTATATGSCEALAKGSGPSQFTDQFGSLYNITCKHDIPGGNLKAVASPTFQDCFAQCDQELSCVGFSWLNGYCYLKAYQQNSVSESPADVAVKVRNGPGVPGTITGEIGTKSATLTVPQVSATSAVPSASAGVSCKQLPPQVGLYKVTCGYDANGGDLSLAQANSFSACIPLCDSMPKCIGFAYVGGSEPGICYFKQEHKPEGANSGVDIAFRPSLDGSVPSGTLPAGLPTLSGSAPTGLITSVLSGPTGLVTSIITAVPSISTKSSNNGLPVPNLSTSPGTTLTIGLPADTPKISVPVLTITGDAITITKTAAPSTSSSSSSSTSSSKPSSSTTTTPKQTSLAITIEPTIPVVPTSPKKEPSSTTKPTGAPMQPEATPKVPILNPGWAIPEANVQGSTCEELLDQNPFRLVTEVIRGRKSLGNCYVQTPLGKNSLSPFLPNGGASIAMVGRNTRHAAHFTWASGGGLAMVNSIEAATRCFAPGFSLMPFNSGIRSGEVSFTPQWVSQGASFSGRSGISFDLNGAHKFGGWRVCEVDQQLKWFAAGTPLDERRCAEVMLKPENVSGSGSAEGEEWIQG